MFGGKNLENLKQMNQMRVRMKRLEKELQALSFEGKSKNDLVTCISDGKLVVQEVRIEDELLAKNDKKLLQKSIKQAVNQSIESAQKAAEERMGEFRGLLSGTP
ncbi:DNA-binding protein, YbaB/EbfC family [Leptospira inadai serovar Lyme str. 10]|uniref:DNA-binding protein, YbaB/EbfC family n=2 Tax=Leptospira inadai serovar Lyme TaxID=293084 RepID=V6HA96_9LEPT|nr:YbaB/EbfC family nucleoid-associated protein [Leptospira inadai]EQA36062.1 DNA-binding protein, YbaB/EbfC family [Leptospira inadai serovar Lyme str. 10]PNV76889.1 nucleoid-associated protein, YbaB/EbfC family [Leptospira inadai serovar Lyme]